MSKLGIGIMGTGDIANRYARELRDISSHVYIAAVGSRNKGTALAFGGQYDVPAERCFGSYEEMCACADVDIVYVATPHGLHYEHMKLALAENKHILCEKCFTVNERQAQETFDEAARRGVYVMDGMWSRFVPANMEFRKRLHGGAIGDIRAAYTVFSANFKGRYGDGNTIPLEHRMINPALGGGAILDMGVYAFSYASMIANDRRPVRVAASGRLYETGLCDGYASAAVLYDDGLVTTSMCGIDVGVPGGAIIGGSAGSALCNGYYFAQAFTINGEEFKYPTDMGGLCYETMAMINDIQAGKLESDIHPHASTLAIMGILDQVREQAGIRYDGE